MHTSHTTVDDVGSVVNERRFGPDDDELELSSVVASAVADAAGVETTELDPLYNSGVDPDALNTLFESGTEEARLTFDYAGYRVRVTGDGHVGVWDA
jgi:acetyl-CoA acetyltransferase